MRFSCSACSASYSLSDEKLAGKTLRFRCKHCPHTITVRGKGLPNAARRSPDDAAKASWPSGTGAENGSPSSRTAPAARYKRRGHLGMGPLGEALLAAGGPGEGKAVLKCIGPLAGAPDPAPGHFLEALGRVASLRLGGVAPLFEAFVADGEALVAREFVEGESLAALAPNLSDRLLATAVARACAALEIAHAAGVAHLGLSPGNLFVRASGDVMLSELGLTAALYGSRRGVAALEARGRYTAPELFAGVASGDRARCDVYSLGVLLGRARDTALRAIAGRASAFEPALRYPSAGALGEALEGYLASGGGVPTGAELGRSLAASATPDAPAPRPA